MGTLTVRENLTFSAALRLSSEFTESDRKVRVEQIIKDLELSQCADTKVSCWAFYVLIEASKYLLKVDELNNKRYSEVTNKDGGKMCKIYSKSNHFSPMIAYCRTPLKTSESQKFFDVFRRYREGTLAWNNLLSLLVTSSKFRTLLWCIYSWFQTPFYFLEFLLRYRSSRPEVFYTKKCS